MASVDGVSLQFSDNRTVPDNLEAINNELRKIGAGVWPLDLCDRPADIRALLAKPVLDAAAGKGRRPGTSQVGCSRKGRTGEAVLTRAPVLAAIAAPMPSVPPLRPLPGRGAGRALHPRGYYGSHY